mmetsp:Transcript_5655/g.14566  ORF Transcript_5655/g.14566 Transcript_5655/m.14566 type:complete len:386 (-) Transcript_5655:257-1414(-)
MISILGMVVVVVADVVLDELGAEIDEGFLEAPGLERGHLVGVDEVLEVVVGHFGEVADVVDVVVEGLGVLLEADLVDEVVEGVEAVGVGDGRDGRLGGRGGALVGGSSGEVVEVVRGQGWWRRWRWGLGRWFGFVDGGGSSGGELLDDLGGTGRRRGPAAAAFLALGRVEVGSGEGRHGLLDGLREHQEGLVDFREVFELLEVDGVEAVALVDAERLAAPEKVRDVRHLVKGQGGMLRDFLHEPRLDLVQELAEEAPVLEMFAEALLGSGVAVAGRIAADDRRDPAERSGELRRVVGGFGAALRVALVVEVIHRRFEALGGVVELARPDAALVRLVHEVHRHLRGLGLGVPHGFRRHRRRIVRREGLVHRRTHGFTHPFVDFTRG